MLSAVRIPEPSSSELWMSAQGGGSGIIPDLGEIPLARELAWGSG